MTTRGARGANLATKTSQKGSSNEASDHHRCEFYQGKTHVSRCDGEFLHFGHSRVTHLSIFGADGHTRRENEHKWMQRSRTVAFLLHIWQWFSLWTMATKSNRWRQERLAERILQQINRKKGHQTRQVTTTDVGFTGGKLMFPDVIGNFSFRALKSDTFIDFRSWWTHTEGKRAQVNATKPHVCIVATYLPMICIVDNGHKVD